MEPVIETSALSGENEEFEFDRVSRYFRCSTEFDLIEFGLI